MVNRYWTIWRTNRAMSFMVTFRSVALFCAVLIWGTSTNLEDVHSQEHKDNPLSGQGSRLMDQSSSLEGIDPELVEKIIEEYLRTKRRYGQQARGTNTDDFCKKNPEAPNCHRVAFFK